MDDDLVRMVMELDANDPGGKWRLQYDGSKLQVYEEDRATIVPPGLAFDMPMTPNPLSSAPTIPRTLVPWVASAGSITPPGISDITGLTGISSSGSTRSG